MHVHGESERRIAQVKERKYRINTTSPTAQTHKTKKKENANERLHLSRSRRPIHTTPTPLHQPTIHTIASTTSPYIDRHAHTHAHAPARNTVLLDRIRARCSASYCMVVLPIFFSGYWTACSLSALRWRSGNPMTFATVRNGSSTDVCTNRTLQARIGSIDNC